MRNSSLRFVASCSIALSIAVLLGACGGAVTKAALVNEKLCQGKTDVLCRLSVRPGTYNESMTVDGRTRTFIVVVPRGYVANTVYPLLLVFHGGSMTNDQMRTLTKFDSMADQGSFIAVFPQGIDQSWNDGRGTTAAEKQGVGDVKFVRDLVISLQAKLSINPNRIYAAGASNGGIFTHRLGCEMSDVLAAIAPDISSMASTIRQSCKPLRPLSVLSIQGDADPAIPVEGGEEGKGGIGAGGMLESMQSAMTFWATTGKCSGSPTVIDGQKASDGTFWTMTRHGRCATGVDVTFYLVHGGGHNWYPNQPSSLAQRILGPSSLSMDVSQVVWAFFHTHPKL